MEITWDRLLLLGIENGVVKIRDQYIVVGRVRWATEQDADGMPLETPGLRAAINAAMDAHNS